MFLKGPPGGPQVAGLGAPTGSSYLSAGLSLSCGQPLGHQHRLWLWFQMHRTRSWLGGQPFPPVRWRRFPASFFSSGLLPAPSRLQYPPLSPQHLIQLVPQIFCSWRGIGLGIFVLEL